MVTNHISTERKDVVQMIHEAHVRRRQDVSNLPSSVIGLAISLNSEPWIPVALAREMRYVCHRSHNTVRSLACVFPIFEVDNETSRSLVIVPVTVWLPEDEAFTAVEDEMGEDTSTTMSSVYLDVGSSSPLVHIVADRRRV